MSDDRLFASNNPIGRKWYFINIIILSVITILTNAVFLNYVIPNALTDAYVIIAKGIMYFADLIYLITFFALIDRRLYDACGSREVHSYRNISGILKFIVFVQIFALYCQWKNPKLPISNSDISNIAWILDIFFIIIVILLVFFKGKISNLSYDDYRKKSKYE